ncbi:MAG: SHOCT domain-containing protein [Deltaproteobacteria bacterium]|nr:SHOCT domain-containing protein [Deltaproteobacteria bacterium]
MKRVLQTGIFCLAILLGISLSGCGGGGAKSNIEARTTTTGQELVDLKNAKDKGVITESEYEDQKKKVLNRKD